MRHSTGLLIALFLFSIPAGLTAQQQSSAQNQTKQTLSLRDRITEIDAKIELLSAQLHAERIEAENAEMQSQPLMYDNWSDYSSVMKDMEKREQRIKQIKDQIHELNLEKQTLLKNNPS